MVHQVNQFRKSGGAYVTRDELEEILAPLVANWEALEAVSTEHDEKILRVEAALDLPLEAELDGEGALPEAVEGDSEEKQAGPDDETEKGRHPAESDPEGLELVEKIHERKSRGKRKPEGQDPLGLVPDAEED